MAGRRIPILVPLDQELLEEVEHHRATLRPIPPRVDVLRALIRRGLDCPPKD